MTQEQQEALTRRDFGRLTATGLGAFALSDVLVNVFRVSGTTAYGCCGCDPCEDCDACDPEECCQGPCDPEQEGCPEDCPPCDPGEACPPCDGQQE